VRLSHAASRLSASFSDPNLVASGGLVLLIRIAERCELAVLVRRHVKLGVTTGANPAGKAMTLVAAMCAGAGCIQDTDMLRTGGFDRLFGGTYAPSTLGSFLRAFTHGHVRQLQGAARRFAANLIPHAGLIAPGEPIVFLDIDSKVKQVYGPAKQGASFGYTKVRGLHFQIVTASTPRSRPVVVATRLRKGSAGSGKGADSLIAEAIRAVREAGITAMILVRADSAFFSAKVVKAIRAAGALFSITVGNTTRIRAAISQVPASAWTPIKYRDAVWDQDEDRWVSEAEIAQIEHTAFTSKNKKLHVTARLIVRRVKRLNPATVPKGQGELFAAHRHHAFLTDSPLILAQAEPMHRAHAIIEQVFADLENGPLAHLPSGKFNANAAWLTLAAIAYNLTRAAGTLAGTFHAKATGATIRRTLINIPARIATSARRIHLHLPEHWPWARAYASLWTATGHRPMIT
jgi:Transposase DDE domain group 1